MDAAGRRRRTQLSRHVSGRRKFARICCQWRSREFCGFEAGLGGPGEGTDVTTRYLTWAVAAGLGSVFFTTPISASAAAVQSGSQTPEAAASQPGNYLAALIASADRDTSSAESYFREALRVDPRNTDLIERAFASALANGDEQGANALGERLLARDPSNGLARLATAVHAIEQGQFAAARAQLASADARSRDVTAAFLTAWCYAGQMDLHRALDSLDRIRDPSVAGFRDFHAGLISDYLG